MKILALAGLGMFALVSAHAQEFSHFTGSIGAGFTQTVGTTGKYLDNGWNLQAGVGFNFSPWVGVMVDAAYNQMGINSTTLGSLGFPGGAVDAFSATLDPIVHLTPHRHFDLYAIGGGGYFHYTQEFSTPTVVGFTGYNPFFGFYSAAVPVDQVLSSYTINKPGIDAGMGIAFGTRWHGKFFAEARYNRVFLGGSNHADWVPVTFGFRF